MPGGTDLWKEIGLAVVGAWVMFWTRSLFSNAGTYCLMGMYMRVSIGLFPSRFYQVFIDLGIFVLLGSENQIVMPR